MKIDLEELSDDPAVIRQLLTQLVALLGEKDRENARLKHIIEKLQRLHFGRSSEKLDPLQQTLAFEGEIATTPPPPVLPPKPETGTEPEKPAPRQKGHGRKRPPSKLRRYTLEISLPEKQRTCSCGTICGRIGEDVSEQVDWIPSCLVVLRRVRAKYACGRCNGLVVTAPVADQVLEKGLPGSGLLAQVITSKYSDHLPLYRQERIFGRHDYPIARSTMYGWVDRVADLLSPIAKRMLWWILQSFSISTDDTIIPIQDPDRDKLRKGRLWVYCGDIHHPFIFYEYSPDHAGKYPIAHLKDYHGHIHADGYSAYAKICDNTTKWLVACWAHARRYFYDAQSNDQLRASYALAFIQQLYRIEKEAKEQRLDDAARQALRQERSVPLLEKFKIWLDEQAPKVMPKDPIHEAIHYCLNRWSDLARYTSDGRLRIDNMVAEQAMRDIAIGRKNWLFAQNDSGGHRAAILYTITQSCKRNGVNVFEYVRDVLERISSHPASQIDDLLPNRWKRTIPTLEDALKGVNPDEQLTEE